MMEEKEFDVVIDTLQARIDALWKMTQSNMSMGLMNTMDDIRLEQISQLKDAIHMWETKE
jgi:hypothetical protein